MNLLVEGALCYPTHLRALYALLPLASESPDVNHVAVLGQLGAGQRLPEPSPPVLF